MLFYKPEYFKVKFTPLPVPFFFHVGGGISAAAAVSIGLFFLILVPVTGVAVREYRKRRQGPPANASFDNVMYLEEKKKESISMTPPSANNTA